MPPRHRDPATKRAAKAPPPRSCTPERDPAGEAAVPEEPAIAAAQNPAPPRAAQQASPGKDLSAHTLMVRFKALVGDIVQLSGASSTVSLEDFIAVAEEAARDMRAAKVASKSFRRQPTMPATTPAKPSTTPQREEKDRILPITLSAPALPEPELRPRDRNEGGGNVQQDAAAAAPPKPTRSYASILQGRTSPKKSKPAAMLVETARQPQSTQPAQSTVPKTGAEKCEELQQRASDTAAAEERASSALRSEERRREAETRRREVIAEKRAKQVAQAERVQLARERREVAAERLKAETEERARQAARRSDEAVQRTKETAAKTTARAEEVQFVNQMTQSNLALRVEHKMAEVDRAQEELRAEKVRAQRERTEAHHAVVERGKELQEERLEKTKQREQQRELAVRRAEEAKRQDQERRTQKKEEREKHVRARQQEVESEAEARVRREQERLAQSEQLREEQRSALKQRADKHDEKVKEARGRKEKDDVVRAPTFHEVMPQLYAADDEKTAARMARVQASALRQARVFREQYQRECGAAPKDINKSRLRAIVGRLVSSTNAQDRSPGSGAGSGDGSTAVVATNMTQARQPLHELLTAAKDLSTLDEEFARFHDIFDPLLALFCDARRCHDAATFKLASCALHCLLTTSAQRDAATVHYFVRAGHLLPIITAIREEIRALRKHNHSAALTACFSLLQLTLRSLLGGSDGKQQPHPVVGGKRLASATVRDQVMELLEAAGVDAFCVAVAATCVDEEDMPCLHFALTVLSFQVEAAARRPTASAQWLQRAVESMLTLLQNVLTPLGQPASGRLSSMKTCVVFAAIRVLNMIARVRFSFMHELLSRGAESGSTAGMELFHVVSGLFRYVAAHDEELERVGPFTDGALAADRGSSKTFADALDLGIVPPSLPTLGYDGEAVTERPCMLRAALHEMLLFIGYASMGDERVQDVFAWGKERPLMSLILSALPIQYFAGLQHVLFPSLVCLCFEHQQNTQIAGREMDVGSIAAFLQGEIDALPPKQRVRLTKIPAVVAQAAAAEEAAGAAGQRHRSPKKSWAEMMDDDDGEDEAAPLTVGAAATTATTAAAATRKDLLLKSVVSGTSGGGAASGTSGGSGASEPRHPAAHFALQRRFPIFKWNEALAYFSKVAAAAA